MTVVLTPETAEKLCVAMLSESYLPRVSGVVHSIEAYARALREAGHRVVIVAPAYPEYRDLEPDVIRFPSLRTPGHSDFPIAIPVSSARWRQLRTLGVNLVHTHSPFLMGVVGARLARVLRCPLIFTHHTLYDEYVHYVPWIGARLTRPTVRAYVKAYGNRCSCVIAPSRFIAMRLRASGVRARIEVLPTGVVDPRAFASLNPEQVRARYGIPANRALLVTASRLGKEKSVEVVLEVFGIVRAAREATLLVVGGGPEEAALRERAMQLGVAADTVFTGLLAHQQTLECLAAGDIFLFASQTETQGLAVVEAMAAGVPVVAVRAGGVAEVIRDGDTGFLVWPDSQALAEKVLFLLDNPGLRQRISDQARDAARAYSLPALTPQLISLYQSLLPSRSTPHRDA